MTDRQCQVLQWIRDYMKDNGWPPSIREICVGFDWSSSSSAHHHLVRLQKDGFLERGPMRRQIRLTRKGINATK